MLKKELNVPKRLDGKVKKEKLLRAACKVFSEKGFHGARISDICREAGANVASVNYYFGDKESLYVEVFRYAFKEHVGVSLDFPEGVTPREKLEEYIKTIIKNFSNMGEKSDFVRLYLMEIANPTGLLDKFWREIIEPKRRELLEVIRDFMGKKEIDRSVIFCEVSIISQCKVILTASNDKSQFLFDAQLSEELLNEFTEHVITFSLAGIDAVK